MLGGEKAAVAFHGDHHPVSIYVDGQAIHEPAESTKSGASVEFEGTYNDAAEVSVAGKSVQNGTPTPDNPVPIESIKSVELVSRGRNLLDAPNVIDLDGAKLQARMYLETGDYCIHLDSCTAERPEYDPVLTLYTDNTTKTFVNVKPVSTGRTQWTFTIPTSQWTRLYTYSDGGWANSQGKKSTWVGLMLERGSVAHPYEPYQSATRTIDLRGHELRSLPDGTHDELVVHRDGTVELVQMVGEYLVTNDSYIGKSTTTGYILVNGVSPTFAPDTTQLVSSIARFGYGTSSYGTTRTSGKEQIVINMGDIDADTAKQMLVDKQAAFQYLLEVPQTIQLPSIDPLPTYHPYTFIDGNGEDISAMVRVMPV